MTNNNVSIGSTTLAGWGTALTAFVAAGITYLTGDHSAQSVTAVELAGIGVLTGSITQIARYFQAHKMIPEQKIAETIGNTLSSKTPNVLLSEGKKVVTDIEDVVKDPASLLDVSQDEEIAHDIDSIATGTPAQTPDGNNATVINQPIENVSPPVTQEVTS